MSGENANESNSILNWAEKEIELAIASEKEAANGTNDWEYGAACYESALRAYKSLVDDGHSGYSIHFTKSILNRLIDGRCLTPIEDEADIWNEITQLDDGTKEYQCKRMSSLFKKVDSDGETEYRDIDRVVCVNINRPEHTFYNGVATRLIDKIFPITMPYLPLSKTYKVFTEEFLFDPKGGDYDTIAYLYILLPSGQKLELNRYFKDGEDGQMVPIEKEEYEDRKEKWMSGNGTVKTFGIKQ